MARSYEFMLSNGFKIYPASYKTRYQGSLYRHYVYDGNDHPTVLFSCEKPNTSVTWHLMRGGTIQISEDGQGRVTANAYDVNGALIPNSGFTNLNYVQGRNAVVTLWITEPGETTTPVASLQMLGASGGRGAFRSTFPTPISSQVQSDTPVYEAVPYADEDTYFTSTSSTYGSETLYNLLLYSTPKKFPGDTSTETDPNNPEGGYIAGDYDNTSDIVGLPSTPAGSINLSMYHIYAPSFLQMNNFARWLWNDNGFDLSQLKRIFQNPIDTILSFAQFPFRTSKLTEDTEHIVIGAIDSELDAYEVSSQYVTIDCGNLQIKPFYGSALDYAPFTKLNLVIPFIGAVSLDTDEVMGKELNITYRVDLLTGTFICYVSVGEYNTLQIQKSVFYQFTGNMASQIPITQGSYIEFAKTLMSVAGGLYTGVGGMVGGSIAGGVIGMAEAGANAISGSKSTVTHTGSLSCNAGFLGCRKPYIIKHIPRQSLPQEYGSIAGFPSNLYDTLGNFRGLTRVSEIHLENINCTKSERSVIDKLLKSGVIINAPTNRVEADGLTLFVNGSENQTIYKSLTLVSNTTGDLRSGEDVENITIDVLTESENFDYLYLSETHRYYFVTKREVLRGGLVRLYCECDVLESHASEILSQKAIVSRNEKRFNLLINDTYFQTYQNPIIVTKEFPSGLTGEGYVLITAGGTIAV